MLSMSQKLQLYCSYILRDLKVNGMNLRNLIESGSHKTLETQKLVLLLPAIKILRDQIRSADVVYVRGGDYEEVVKVFDHIKDEFHALLNGKVYAGSSAGVLAISQYGRSHSTSEWKPGLGLIPAVSFVHYSENGKESVEAFKSEHKDTDYEYLLLPETEFVIREY